MIVLGIESSTPVASVAVVSGGGLLGEITLNVGLTHSEQLLPMVDDVLKQTRIPLTNINGIAVAGGPGSFTGLRIGMATAKGLAQGRNIPLVGIPTLRALAYTQAGFQGLVSPVLNARRGEVYTALFNFSDKKEQLGKEEQLIEDQAMDPLTWAQTLKEKGEPVVFVGDGAGPYQDIWRETLGALALLPPPVSTLPRASTVAWLGRERLLRNETDDLFGLKPFYIRPVEAKAKFQAAR